MCVSGTRRDHAEAVGLAARAAPPRPRAGSCRSVPAAFRTLTYSIACVAMPRSLRDRHPARGDRRPPPRGPVRRRPASARSSTASRCRSRPATTAAIELFAREVRAAEHADDETARTCSSSTAGPGMPTARPTSRRRAGSSSALEHFHVLLLDQRGTGLSTPVTAQTLTGTPRSRPSTSSTSAPTRSSATPSTSAARCSATSRWAIFGQSFGGFTALTYLSFAPEGVQRGVRHRRPAAARRARSTTSTARRTRGSRRASAEYLDRYPEDEAVWERVVAREPRATSALGNDARHARTGSSGCTTSPRARCAAPAS